jgi:23S rRNA-/tRNA-specific pseudouridylate synthase
MTPAYTITIIHENSFFLIIDKPAGFSIHNTSPSVLEELKKMNKPDNFVNRLDQETSGLVVVSQKPQFHEGLQQALTLGVKSYKSLLRGQLAKTNERLVWNKPLTDQAEGRRNPLGSAKDQKDCLTEVTVLRTNKYFTEINAVIKTGRQHQIRKHAAIAKHPVVGDKRYNEPQYNQQISELYKNDRMQLHAESIEFKYGGENYSFKSSNFSLDQFFKV